MIFLLLIKQHFTLLHLFCIIFEQYSISKRKNFDHYCMSIFYLVEHLALNCLSLEGALGLFQLKDNTPHPYRQSFYYAKFTGECLNSKEKIMLKYT